MAQVIRLQTVSWTSINLTNTAFYFPEPRAEVYCLQLNFKISKLANWFGKFCIVCKQPIWNTVFNMLKIAKMWKLNLYLCTYLSIYIFTTKPLSATGISEDNAQGWKIVRKMNSWPRSEASRTTVKFWGQCFSRGHYLRYTSKLKRGLFQYFITLRIISLGERTKIVPVYFAELSTSFLISPPLASAKSIL